MNHGPERITLAQFMQLGLQRVNLLHLLEEIVARYLFDAGDQFAIRQFQSVVRAGEAGLRYILYGELVGIFSRVSMTTCMSAPHFSATDSRVLPGDALFLDWRNRYA